MSFRDNRHPSDPNDPYNFPPHPIYPGKYHIHYRRHRLQTFIANTITFVIFLLVLLIGWNLFIQPAWSQVRSEGFNGEIRIGVPEAPNSPVIEYNGSSAPYLADPITSPLPGPPDALVGDTVDGMGGGDKKSKGDYQKGGEMGGSTKP